jgi:very-short-patch-repair endonuclease
MNSLGWVLFLVLLGLVAAVFFKLRGSNGATGGVWPLHSKKPLTAPQQTLYFRLTRALPDHIVLPQVALSRFLGVKAGQDFHAWHNRIDRLTTDFVVCAKDARVLAVIELDDATHHHTREQQRADAKKQQALESAGLRVIRWQAKSLPDEATIRTELYATSSGAAAAPVRSPARERGESPKPPAKAQATGG